MTGLEDNRQIYLPQEIQDRLPKRFLLTEMQPRSLGTLGEVILNLEGQIDSLLPEVHFLFYNTIMLLKEKMIILIGSLLALPWI